ncbi:MAG TPA: amidohydrolase family protein [Longimicrobium sp.]|jgi:imidazolonepropionase-like amidohydrolase
MILRLPALVLAAALAGAAPAAPARALAQPAHPDSEGVVAFVDVDVLPMDRERVLRGQTVLVRGGTIAAVGPAARVAVPAGAARVDGRGRYLMPGLADLHVHLYDTEGFVSYLAHGVTTVANLHGSPAVLGWRREVRSGARRGPTVYTAGPTLNGYPAGNPLFVAVASPEAARAAVRDQKRAGYDFVKVYSFLDPDVYRAVADQARAERIAVVGHVPILAGVEAVLGSGQANIAHVEEFFQAGDVDDARIPGLAAAVARAGVSVTPNLFAYADYLRAIADLPGVLADPEMRYASAAALGEKLPASNRSVRPNPADFAAFLTARRARFQKLTRALQDAGAQLLLGTDTEIFGFAGESAHRELDELVAAGLTSYQALAAATRNAGEFVARSVEGAEPFGTVAPGSRADLLLLEASPLDDVRNVGRLRGVMARGRWMAREELQRMRDSVAAVQSALHPQVYRLDSLVAAGRGGEAARLLRRLRAEAPGAFPVAEVVLRSYAWRLWAKDRPGSIELRRIMVDLYPESSSAESELAWGYLAAGDTALALAHFRKALALEPRSFTPQDMVARLEAARLPPGFAPAGRYELEPVPMRVGGERKEVALTLEVAGSPGAWRARLRSSAAPEAEASQLVIGGGRIWTAAQLGGERLELRLSVQGDRVEGTWVLGIMNSGPLRGRKLPP